MMSCERRVALVSSGRKKVGPKELVSSAVDELVVRSMSSGIAGFSRLSEIVGGLRPGQVNIVDDVVVTVTPSDKWIWMADRVREIDEFAHRISELHSVGLTEARSKLFLADGWSINRRSVKTPAWMNPSYEVVSGDMCRISNFGWFAGVIEWFEGFHHENSSKKIQGGRKSEDAKRGGDRSGDEVMG